MDKALLALLCAVERGDPVPPLRLYTGPTLIFGVPIRASEALELMKTGLAEAHYRAAEPKRRERDEVSQKSWLAADSEINSFRSALGEASDAISLKQPTVFNLTTGEQLVAMAMRVPVSAIDSWFIGSFEARVQKGGSSFFVGFAAPLSN